MTRFLDRLFRKKKAAADTGVLPVHIAIIMDGNGRWARKRGLPRNVGHREGAGTIKKIVRFCAEIGIKCMTVFAFSTENWKRPKSEVDGLMALLMDFLSNAEKELAGSDIRIRVIGEINGLSKEMQTEIARVENLTENRKGMTLLIALNYGGRNEILSAVRDIAGEAARGRIRPQDIDESMISERLYTSGMPDPDLIIRTSGEKRISNFLLWQSAYSEFLYSDVLWPDFSEEDIMKAIREYQNRNRRFGGTQG